MKKLLLLVLCGAILLSFTACKKDIPEDNSQPEVSTVVTPVPDPVISRFITEYNELSKLDLHDYFRQDDAVNSYKGVAGRCDVYITSNTADPSNPELHITIMGGTTEEDQARMFAVFTDVAQVLDTYVSKDQLKQAVDHMTAQTSTLTNYRFCGYLEVKTYMPILNIGTGIVPCRIDLVGYQYFAE